MNGLRMIALTARIRRSETIMTMKQIPYSFNIVYSFVTFGGGGVAAAAAVIC